MITERFSFSSREKAAVATATLIFSAPIGIHVLRAFSERRRNLQVRKEALRRENITTKEIAEDSYNAGDSGFDFSQK